MRFPLSGDIRGALFVDAGNVFTPPFTYRLNELRYAVGPGIRYLTPIGPLRLDVGFVLDPGKNEDPYRLDFSIGQAF
jgi:outer membrane protein insertion porin family